MFDCGAIYESQRNWAMRGTVISNNMISNVGRAETVCNVRTSCGRHAIYMDALTDGVTVRDNVLVQPAVVAVGNGNPHIIDGSSAIMNRHVTRPTVDKNAAGSVCGIQRASRPFTTIFSVSIDCKSSKSEVGFSGIWVQSGSLKLSPSVF